jgi:Ca2+-binding RTX toxin-like protein
MGLPANAFGANASVENGVAVYAAAPGEVNAIAAGIASGTATFTDPGAVITAGAGCTQVNAHEVTCSLVSSGLILAGDMNDSVTITEGDFQAEGGAGHDELTVCATCVGRLFGNAGDDTLQGGDVPFGRLAASNYLYGGRGADTITGGRGNDLVDGGNGADTLIGAVKGDFFFPGPGNDRVEGGVGHDWVFLQHAPGPVNVDLRAGTLTGWGTKTLASVEKAVGTRFSDTIYGDGGRNRLYGFRGNDRLSGRSGKDVFFAGPGADILLGGPEDDMLWGGSGRDRIYGGRGADRIKASDGHRERDLVDGGADVDTAYVDKGIDIVRRIEVLFFFSS